ncbi:MAG: DUF3520 domain-containing protein [Planctomycetota bacterium]|nr:DUF3520 domain-containing protein [Planctomycetota bacterium]
MTPEAAEGELLTLKLRWKEPDGDRSELLEVVAHDGGAGWSEASDDFRFAAAVASFGLILARSEHGGAVGASDVLELATSAVGADPHGERTTFLDLVLRANELLGS